MHFGIFILKHMLLYYSAWTLILGGKFTLNDMYFFFLLYMYMWIKYNDQTMKSTKSWVHQMMKTRVTGILWKLSRIIYQ